MSSSLEQGQGRQGASATSPAAVITAAGKNRAPVVLPVSPVRSGSGESVPRVLHHLTTNRSPEAARNDGPTGLGVSLGSALVGWARGLSGDGAVVSGLGEGAAAGVVVDDRVVSVPSIMRDHAHEDESKTREVVWDHDEDIHDEQEGEIETQVQVGGGMAEEAMEEEGASDLVGRDGTQYMGDEQHWDVETEESHVASPGEASVDAGDAGAVHRGGEGARSGMGSGVGLLAMPFGVE
ncbi:hypothetical protein T484DRAFT_1895972, partial [Baffinella frigidus]